MITGERYIDGLTHLEAFNGINVAEIPGSSGLGPEIVVIFWGADDLPVGPEFAIIGYPSATGGSGSSGSISCLRTFTNTGDDKEYDLSGATSVTFPEGFWATEVRSDVNTVLGTRWFYIQFSSFDPDDAGEFPGVPPPPKVPTKPEITDPDPEDDTGQVEVSWLSTSDNVTDDDGFLIKRSYNGATARVVGSVPRNAATFPNYTFTDYLNKNGTPGENIGEGTFTYTIQAYKYNTNTITAPSTPSDDVVYTPSNPPPPPVEPSIEIPDVDFPLAGTGGIDLGGAAVIQFVTNPAGIYTLVPGKLHDTLYSGATSVDVKIPDPTFKTAYLGSD